MRLLSVVFGYFLLFNHLRIFLLGVQDSRVTKYIHIYVHVLSRRKLATREIRVQSPVQASFYLNTFLFYYVFFFFFLMIFFLKKKCN